MTDTILRGTGNSRTLRTVANAKSQYPTYDAFMTALVNGTFPIDIGALSSAGLTRRGTDLNKANILTDSTATGMGLTSSATPNDAFAKLRTLVKAAQDAADEINFRVFVGSYVGTNSSSGPSYSKTLNFPFRWKFLLVNRPIEYSAYTAFIWRDNPLSILINLTSSSFKRPLSLVNTDTSCKWTEEGGGGSALDKSGVTYHYLVIGTD